MSEILKPTPEQLKLILDDHKKWLARDPAGKRMVLRSADLRYADLSSAVLRSADLRYADLSYADLRSADLRSADLRYADLSSAVLRSADLRSADLSSADLRSADLSSAKNAELPLAMTEILPREGAVVCWKKCAGGVVAKLLIPADSPRSNATGRKCRAEFVDTLELPPGVPEALSMRDAGTTYRVGERTRCDKWDPDRWAECTGGIHVWLTREEAEAWTG